MKWSKELPCEPGFYWCKLPGQGQSVVLFRDTNQGLVMECDDDQVALVSDLVDGLEFAGPIGEPEEAE